MKKISFLLVSILFVSTITGCVNNINNEKNNTTDYKIVSRIPYYKGLCTSISDSMNNNGFNTGFRIVIRDSESGEELDYLLSVFSDGYSPEVFEVNMPRNEMVNIEIRMHKSCEGRTGCFENMKPENREALKDMFYDEVSANFGLDKADYELDCTECDMDRGGFIKARGTYEGGSRFELNYDWGWCSSGGSDCGWELCFSTEDENLFNSVKEHVCGKIYHKQDYDGYICEDEAFDYTEDVRNECLSGKFERNVGGRKTLAINQISNRCESSVEIGSFDCI